MNSIHLRDKYNELKQNKYKNLFSNTMLIPSIKKITINAGISKLLKTKGAKSLEHIMQDLYNITYQKPAIIRAKKSCDGFFIKKDDITHLKVTLRKKRMYDFLTKLILFDLPRSRDFRGLKLTSFDKFGNYIIGIDDCTIFHGIDKKNIFTVFGFNIVITTNSNKEDTYNLLKDLNFIFNE